MKSNTSFPYILNQLFKVFDEVSRITINYKGYPSAPDDPDVTDFRIISVNGFKSHNEFTDYLHYLGTNLIRSAMKASEELSPGENIIFFEQVISRFKPLASVVIFEKFYPRPDEWNAKHPSGRYHFNMPELEGDIYHEFPYYHIDRIVREAWKYSLGWKKTIDHFLHKLTLFSTMIEFIPFTPVSAQSEESIDKLPIRTNVRQLAALIYFLIERRFFDTSNKSEICRTIAKTFRTKGQDNISPVSLKNHVDTLDPEAILFWQEEFNLLLKTAQKLLQKFPV